MAYSADEKAYIKGATGTMVSIASAANLIFHGGISVRNVICKLRHMYLHPLSRYDTCQLMHLLRLYRCPAAVQIMRSRMRKV